MDFRTFQTMNKARCAELFRFQGKWPIQNWALAIAGEAGELCNLIKKTLRGDFTVEDKIEEILLELADVITYCDLAITELGADTEKVLLAKFDLVSKRHGGWKWKR